MGAWVKTQFNFPLCFPLSSLSSISNPLITHDHAPCIAASTLSGVIGNDRTGFPIAL
jgi:hypothetical protein